MSDQSHDAREHSLRSWATVSQAARMLGVAPSTLTRRVDLDSVRRGDRDHVLAVEEVMRLAAIYRKRSLNEVAADLVALASEHGERIEDAIDAWFEARDRIEEGADRGQ